ncbi:MAG: site-specific integrase, partial [Deltaproteobacteria bacterium]|nr:site-specific integrase [Deltaproteobacteria bacterium]
MSPHPHRALSGPSNSPGRPDERDERVGKATSGEIVRPTRLTEQQFWALADIPAEAEWFANIRNKHTRRAYKLDVHDFLNFTGIDVVGIRAVTRPHVIAWRKDLERRQLSPSTIRRKLSALSALFGYLCEYNANYLNPVNGVERPAADANEGKTPAIGDAQARALLACPSSDTLKGKRDGALLATFLYHGLRAEELVKLKVKDVQERRGVKHFRVHGKGSKIRYVPVHPAALDRIDAYTAAAGHALDLEGALFRPTKVAAGAIIEKAIAYRSVYDVIKRYAVAANIP